jgi:serine/threonine-protein kinase
MSLPEPPVDEPTAYRSPEETPTVVVRERARRELQFTPGMVLGGRYRIVSLIGRGGMGEVYRADDLKVGHTVALKFLSNHEHALRLYEEVRIGRQISHPNVCRLYDAAEVEGQLFITMEFIDGEDLASLLRRVGRLSSEKGLAVAHDICAGVAAAHEKGVIHRDLKPANVMIDGRGRARVTDFGLAVAGEGVMDRAGTPAYMAPEQLSGGAASIASDIYALGLILYEVFTGARPFASASLSALRTRQLGNDYIRPSSVTREIPAAVERVIVRCLDPEPRFRPASVQDVVRELPGGDALTAAVAAGETPSPAMVAAAAKSGELPPVLAWLMFSVAVAGFAATAILAPRTVLQSVAEMKSPDVLQERARQILNDAGLKERPGDADLFAAMEAGGSGITAVYRQSRWAMRPLNPNATLRRADPPLDQGMARVELDAGGRLLRFAIVPPLVETRRVFHDPDWRSFISAAGYEPASLRRTDPNWSAPIDSDSKNAWITKDGNRIEVAAYHGQPVSFEVITKEFTRSASAPPGFSTGVPERIAYSMFVVFMIGIPIAALALARVHLRRKQSDRRGAFRVALFFLAVDVTALLFQAHHPMQFIDEWRIVSWHIAQATFWALVTGIIYIALEPYVRKRWPQILISWTRLLSGRFTDPMIGRDVLMGAAGAALAVATWHVTNTIAGQTAFFAAPYTLGPARFVVASLADTVAEAVLRGVGLVILLVILRRVISSDAAASLLTIALIATMTLGETQGSVWLRGYYAVTASFAGVLLARHFGMLAVMSYAFFVLVQQRIPFTFDRDAWYFGRSAVVMVLMMAIISYAFRISAGSGQLLPRFSDDS